MFPLLSLLFLNFLSLILGKEFAVVSYLPEWRYSGANFEVICLVSTHLIFFSLEPNFDGKILGFDERFPSQDILNDARHHGCQIMICFGGNGRSNGFSNMTRNPLYRHNFLNELQELMTQYQLDGVDYNWEYPGYSFGYGYHSEDEIQKDYQGLKDLLIETRQRLGPQKIITIAYYPDKRQEKIFLETGIATDDHLVDLMHIMAYDQSGAHHSSYKFGVFALNQGIEIGLPKEKLTLGLPFYGRNRATGDWTTYEDLVQKYHPLNQTLDQLSAPPVKKKNTRSKSKKETTTITFNGIETIQKKTQYALDRGAGGVMIWEGGGDCRVKEVTRGGQTHVATCPNGEDSSLLIAIKRVIQGCRKIDNEEL